MYAVNNNKIIYLHLTEADLVYLNQISKSWSRGYKTFFMLNSAEHEILTGHKYQKSLN